MTERPGTETSIRIVAENLTEYIPSIGRIYREAFPHHARSLLGQSTCERYFKVVSQHKAYRLMVALVDDESAGFVVIHVDMQAHLGRKWLFRSTIPILRFAISNPLLILGHVRKRLAPFYNRGKARISAPSNKNVVRNRGASAYIDTIAVKESFRGLGLGKRLVDECIRVGRENNIERLGLTVDMDNDEAVKLYQAIGFKQRYDPAGGRVNLVYHLRE